MPRKKNPKERPVEILTLAANAVIEAPTSADQDLHNMAQGLRDWAASFREANVDGTTVQGNQTPPAAQHSA